MPVVIPPSSRPTEATLSLLLPVPAQAMNRPSELAHRPGAARLVCVEVTWLTKTTPPPGCSKPFGVDVVMLSWLLPVPVPVQAR